MVGARIVAWLRANGWVLNLTFVGLGAYFVAGATSAVLARSVRVVPTLENSGQPRPPHLAPRQSEEVLYAAISERNLLNAKTEVLLDEAATPDVPENASETPGTWDEGDLRPCTLPAALRATLVAERTPEWSMAVLYLNNERDTQVYSVNSGSNQISDDATLVEIRDLAVVVRRRDHFELCESDKDAKPPARVPSRPTISRRSSDEAGGGGVTRVSEGNYVIEGRRIEDVMANLSQVATQARIVPSFRAGKPDGFKLFSIKPNSIFQQVGMQNGDIIQKIDGYKIDSPDKALEIYQKLKDATGLSIEFKRRGRTMNFNYSIDR